MLPGDLIEQYEAVEELASIERERQATWWAVLLNLIGAKPAIYADQLLSLGDRKRSTQRYLKRIKAEDEAAAAEEAAAEEDA